MPPRKSSAPLCPRRSLKGQSSQDAPASIENGAIWLFEEGRVPKDVAITNSGMTVSLVQDCTSGVTSMLGVGLTEGRQTWSIKINEDSGGDIGFGVCGNAMKLARALGGIPIGGPNAASWAYHSQGNAQGGGRKRSNGKFLAFGLGCRTGDVVSLELTFPSSDAAAGVGSAPLEGVVGVGMGGGGGGGASRSSSGATLRVYRNFEDMGVAFENVAVTGGGLWPAITLYKLGQSVSVLRGDVCRGEVGSEQLPSLSGEVAGALTAWDTECETAQREVAERFRVLQEELRAQEVAAREKLNAMRACGNTLLRRQQELLATARATCVASSYSTQSAPGGTSIDNAGTLPDYSNGAGGLAAAAAAAGVAGLNETSAASVYSPETEGEVIKLPEVSGEIRLARVGPCPLECVLTDADRSRLAALRAHVAELQVTRVAAATKGSQQQPPQASKAAAERLDKARQLLAKKQAMVDTYLENLKRANLLAPTDLQPLAPSHPLARSFQLVLAVPVLRGWVEQPSPSCAAASVAGTWNAIFGLFDGQVSPSSRSASARSKPPSGVGEDKAASSMEERHLAGGPGEGSQACDGQCIDDAARVLRQRTGGGVDATELAGQDEGASLGLTTQSTTTMPPSRSLALDSSRSNKGGGSQQGTRDLNRDTLAAAGLPGVLLDEIFGVRSSQEGEKGRRDEGGNEGRKQGSTDCSSVPEDRPVQAGTGAQGGSDGAVVGHMGDEGSRGQGSAKEGSVQGGYGHSHVLAVRQGMRRQDTWDVLRVYADMWRAEVDVTRRKLASLLDLAAVEDIAPLESALERHWPAIDASIAMPVLPVFPSPDAGKRGAKACRSSVSGSSSPVAYEEEANGGGLGSASDDDADGSNDNDDGDVEDIDGVTDAIEEEGDKRGERDGDDVSEPIGDDDARDDDDVANAEEQLDFDEGQVDGESTRTPGSLPAVRGQGVVQGQGLRQARSASLPMMPPLPSPQRRVSAIKMARALSVRGTIVLSSPSSSSLTSSNEVTKPDETQAAEGGGSAMAIAGTSSAPARRPSIPHSHSTSEGSMMHGDGSVMCGGGAKGRPNSGVPLGPGASNNTSRSNATRSTSGGATAATAAASRAPYKPPSKAHMMHILKMIVAEASSATTSTPHRGLADSHTATSTAVIPACIAKLGALISLDKSPAAQAVALAARSYLEKRGALAKVTRERPSTAPVGNERLMKAIKHLAATHGVAASVRTWCVMGAAGTKRKQDYELTPTDSEQVVAEHWAALKAWLARPCCALIFHLENHYSPVYATRYN
eukprot:jgi/Mesvir1/22360/Mv17862-RA.1